MCPEDIVLHFQRFWGSVAITNPCFLVFLALFSKKKNKERKDREGPGLESATKSAFGVLLGARSTPSSKSTLRGTFWLWLFCATVNGGRDRNYRNQSVEGAAEQLSRNKAMRIKPTLRAQRLKKFKIALRDWNFQVSHPANPYVLCGILKVRILAWNFQARFFFSSEIVFFNLWALRVGRRPRAVRPVLPMLVFQLSKQQNRTRTTSSAGLGTSPNRTRTKRFPLEELWGGCLLSWVPKWESTDNQHFHSLEAYHALNTFRIPGDFLTYMYSYWIRIHSPREFFTYVYSYLLQEQFLPKARAMCI